MAQPETLHDLLTTEGLRPKATRAGGNTKMLCPKCDGGRTHEMSLSLKIDDDGEGATAHCNRSSCGWTWGGRTHDSGQTVRRPSDRATYRPAPFHSPAATGKPEALYEFFAARKLSRETVDAFGCYVLTGHKFPGEMGVHDAIVFPYRHRAEVVNRKYRAIQSKEITGQDFQALPTLFNIEAVTSPDCIVWVEGEPDAMAVHETGYPQVVTLKDGAPGKLRDEADPAREGDKRFAALETHKDALAGWQKIILAGDMDAPGAVLREELARRLGRHRCWTVDWPEGCKDAGDVLREYGPAQVATCIEAAKPYPIEGVHEVSGAMLDRYLEMPAPPVMTTGITAVDAILKIPGEGRVIVITGYPNCGKTPFATNLMVHLMRRYARKFLVFSPEMQPLEEFLVMVAEILVGKPARGGYAIDKMTREERSKAGNWLQGRMSFLSSDAENHIPSLDWILEKARAKVLQSGITDLVIDPFNEVEQSNGRDLTETQFIGQSLQRANAFALRHGCNVWIIAHPAKPQPPKQGEKPLVPNGYSISGSAHWFNKCALGITVHRPEEGTEIHIWKAKFKRHGKKGDMARIEYDLASGRYLSPTISYSERDDV